MTRSASGARSTGRGHADRIQRREAALASARQFLASLASTGHADVCAADLDLAERLSACREHLAAIIAASRPEVLLARTVDEAATALGVSPITVYRLINDGDLAAYRIARRHIRIKESALQAYLAGRIVRPGEITGPDIPLSHLPSQ